MALNYQLFSCTILFQGRRVIKAWKRMSDTKKTIAKGRLAIWNKCPLNNWAVNRQLSSVMGPRTIPIQGELLGISIYGDRIRWKLKLSNWKSEMRRKLFLSVRGTVAQAKNIEKIATTPAKKKCKGTLFFLPTELITRTSPLGFT